MKPRKLFSKGRRRAPGEMNKIEAAYHQQLEIQMRVGEIQWFKYEGIKLRLADKTFFTADFFVMNSEGFLEVHEVKAFWKSKDKPHIEDDANVKIKVVAEMYPFKFSIVWLEPTGWKMREI